MEHLRYESMRQRSKSTPSAVRDGRCEGSGQVPLLPAERRRGIEPDDPLCSRNARPPKDGGARLGISRKRFPRWGLRSDRRLRRLQRRARKHHHPKRRRSKINNIALAESCARSPVEKGRYWVCLICLVNQDQLDEQLKPDDQINLSPLSPPCM